MFRLEVRVSERTCVFPLWLCSFPPNIQFLLTAACLKCYLSSKTSQDICYSEITHTSKVLLGVADAFNWLMNLLSQRNTRFGSVLYCRLNPNLVLKFVGLILFYFLSVLLFLQKKKREIFFGVTTPNLQLQTKLKLQL